MLRDLGNSLSACLAAWLPSGVGVRLDPPQASWVADPPGAPFVDAYLYDLREDARATAADAVLLRDENGRAQGWQAPIRRYRAGFLVSAWPAGSTAAAGTAEYDLLDAILVSATTDGRIPERHLRGSLAGAPIPVLLYAGPSERSVDSALVWSSLGVPGRVALDLLVVGPLIPPLNTELAAPARQIAVDVAHGDDAVPSVRPAAPQRWPAATVRE